MKASMSELRRILSGRAVLTAAVWVAYAFALVPLYRQFGPAVLPFAAAPVVATGWFYGTWAGLAASLLVLPLNALLVTRAGEVGWVDVMARGLPGHLVAALLGVGTGRIRDLNVQVGRDLTERKRAAEALQRAHGEAEARAAERAEVNARLEQEISERKRRERLLHALNQASRSLEEAPTPEEIFAAVAGELEKLGFTCIVFLLDETQKNLFVRYWSYESGVIRAAEKLVGLNHEEFALRVEVVDAWKRVVWERETVFIENVGDIIEQVLRPALPGLATTFAARIAKILKASKDIGAPLIVEDQVIGMFTVQSADLTTDDMPAITAFAHQMAAAWRKARLLQDLQKSLAEGQRAEEELRKRKELLQSIMDHTAALVTVRDTEGTYVLANRRFEQVAGIDPGEAVGMTPHDFYSARQTEGLLESDRQVVESGEPMSQEVAGWLNDGSRAFLSTKVPLFDAGGKAYAVCTVATEITERVRAAAALRDSEARFRQLFENMSSGVAIYEARDDGQDFVLADLNSAAERIEGVRREDLIGHSVLDVFIGVREFGLFEAFQRVWRTGEPEHHPISMHQDQRIVDWRENHVYKLPSGEVVAVYDDITERKKAEEQLKRYAVDLEQANEDVKQFAYIVSHDLRAPLVNLKGFSTELRAALAVTGSALVETLPHLGEKRQQAVSLALEEDIPEFLGFIEASVTRMDHFINAVLRLSRLGQRELWFEPVDMNVLVQAALQTLAHQIKEHQTQVSVGALPEVVADRISMEQIMGNVLGNAVKYLETGRPGQLDITGEQGPDGTTFHVRDNGRGIAERDMDKVFAPFRRAGRQDVPGEGMGLAYVQTMVRRHGGRVWCESEPGKGSTFHFTIPANLMREAQS